MKRLLLIVWGLVFGFQASSQTIAEFLKDTLDKTFDLRLNGVGDKGMVSAIYFPDGSTWTRAGGKAGTTDLEADQLYQIGSCTKTMIAAVIMKLQEEGKLDIDDSIYQYISSKPNVDSVITIRQLLDHTAGTFNYTDHPLFGGHVNSGLSKFWPVDTIYNNYVNAATFSPGSRYGYSNTGYVLLGSIIEAVEGKALNVVLKDRLFTPYGFDQMYLGGYDSFSKSMPGTWFLGGTYLDTDITAVLSSAWAAGAVISHPIQHAKWVHDLYGGKIVSKASLLEMIKTTQQSGNAYGLGTIVRRDMNRVYHGHGGAILHYSSMDYSTESKFGAVTISIDATSSKQAIVQNYLLRVTEALIANAPKPVDNTSVFESQFDNEVAIYPNPAYSLVNVSNIEVDRLTLKALDGRSVKNVDHENSIDVSDLQRGNYLLLIEGEGKILRKKLILH